MQFPTSHVRQHSKIKCLRNTLDCGTRRAEDHRITSRLISMFIEPKHTETRSISKKKKFIMEVTCAASYVSFDCNSVYIQYTYSFHVGPYYIVKFFISNWKSLDFLKKKLHQSRNVYYNLGWFPVVKQSLPSLN